MICVTTRFRLTYPWQLLSMYLLYRHMAPDLKSAPGLIRYAFTIQGPSVCYTFSLWESKEAIMRFSNVPSHLKALRSAKRMCREIWSAYWQIAAISQFANRWEDSVPWPTMVDHIVHPPHFFMQEPL